MEIIEAEIVEDIEVIETQLTDRTWIKQANELNQSRYTLSALAYDVLSVFLTELKQEHEGFVSFKVKMSDLEKKLGRRIDKSSLRKASRELISTIISVEDLDSKGSYLDMTWCSSAQYFAKESSYMFSFDPNLSRYLLNLDNGDFTKTRLKGLLMIKGYHSKRLFSLLSQFRSTGFFTISVEKLKYILELDNKYAEYKDFKKRVIKPTIDQVENLFGSQNLRLVEKKVGRKVMSLEFYMEKK